MKDSTLLELAIYLALADNLIVREVCTGAECERLLKQKAALDEVLLAIYAEKHKRLVNSELERIKQG
jgi:hypothetical protein